MTFPSSTPGPGAGAVVPLRLRTGGLSSRVVHLIPAVDRQILRTGPVAALCGSLLFSDAVEQVELGTGLPCSACLTLRVLTADPVTPGPDTPPVELIPYAQRATPAGYAALEWPVRVRGEQVSVRLGTAVVAFLIPTELAERSVAVLADRQRPAPVLAHLHHPGHRIVLAVEPFGVPLPLPAGVRALHGELPLPAGPDARGLVRWTALPGEHPTDLAREIDLCAVLRTLAGVPLTNPNAGRSIVGDP